jgi:hypothetical protein
MTSALERLTDRPPPTRDELLAIYLNDHLAGSMMGIELVKRAAGEHADTPLGGFLSGLAAEIEADRQALRAIMTHVGARESPGKLAIAWAAEKAGRLKLNGTLLRRSPLTPMLELEALATGIFGKLQLWKALSALDRDWGPAGARLPELIARAEDQLERIEEHRLAAARDAVASE